MIYIVEYAPFVVNCRVGSLENFVHTGLQNALVNCRVGSLERCLALRLAAWYVNCRVGSLEINGTVLKDDSVLTAV